MVDIKEVLPGFFSTIGGINYFNALSSSMATARKKT